MRKLVIAVVAVCTFGFAGLAAAAEEGKVQLKAGDQVYVCACGEKCPCETISKNGGKCTCSKEMVKAKVTKVDKDMVYVQAEGWDKPRGYNPQGKYMCACGPSCNCGTISQNPGKCVCGNDLKPVEAKPAT